MWKPLRSFVVFALAASLPLGGCGGGGGGSSAPPPCAAATRTCFVSVNGNDSNSGADPADALKTISRAAQLAQDGYTIIALPGTYRENVSANRIGNVAQALTFRSQTARDVVVVDASGTSGAGFNLSSTEGTVIDGFTITGASDAGIVIKSGSNNFTIQNCIVHDNPGDGIRVQDSANALVFNNLVYNNGARGVAIVGTGSGSKSANVINNTIYGHGDRGITIGTTQADSRGAFLRNNIVQLNALLPNIDANIRVYTPPPNTVPNSLLNYNGNFDLVFAPAKYIPASAQGANDVAADALFVKPATPDFHLRANSPAVDAGDPLNNFQAQRNILRMRTTSSSGSLDSGNLDLGYHYAP